jgi:hypothetical protein
MSEAALPMATIPRLYTLPAAERVLAENGADVSAFTLRREAHRGRLKLTKIGRRLFVREDHLEEYLRPQDMSPCRSAQAQSEAIGLASARIPQPGAAPGSTGQLDKRDAHRLAQMTFSKPS